MALENGHAVDVHSAEIRCIYVRNFSSKLFDDYLREYGTPEERLERQTRYGERVYGIWSTNGANGTRYCELHRRCFTFIARPVHRDGAARHRSPTRSDKNRDKFYKLQLVYEFVLSSIDDAKRKFQLFAHE